MLTLPPKMQRALDLGIFTPVISCEVTTGVINAPPSQQTRRLFGTVEGREGVELTYPAQPGDDLQIDTLVYQGFGGTNGAAIRANFRVDLFSAFTRFWNPSASVYQTFTVGEDIGQAAIIRECKAQLRRTDTVGAGWQIRARIYRVDPDGNLSGLVVPGDRVARNTLNDFAGGVESATVIDPATLTIDTNVTVTFAFNLPLIPGLRYAFLLYPVYTSGAIPNPPGISVFWMGTHRFVNPNEWSGSILTTAQSDRFNTERSLEVRVAPYSFSSTASYNGAANPNVEIWIDMNGTPVSEGELRLRYKIKSFRDPVSGTVKTTDMAFRLWSGASLGAKTTDLGAVQDGSKITTFSRYYVLRAELRTASTTTLLRTPVFIGANLIFPQVVGGAPRSYTFSTHPLPFSIAPAIARAPSIPTKLDPTAHLTQRGGFSIELIDIAGEVTRIATEENLVNLPVEVRVGHIDAATKSDMVVIGQGIVTDYQYEEGRLTLWVEDRTKQLSVKIPKRSINSIQYIQSGGVVNAYTLSHAPAHAAYTDKMLLPWEPHVKNTGPSTLNDDGLGAITIKKVVNGLFVDLADGDLVAGRRTHCQYDASGPRFILVDTLLVNAILGDSFRRDYQYKHMLDVAVEIMADDADISRRWIATSAFAAGSTLRNYLGNDFITHLVLTEPTEAKDLIGEIMMLVGAYLVAREDGVLTPIQYPRSDVSVETWDKNILTLDDQQESGFAATIKNNVLVQWDKDNDRENRGVVIAIDPAAQDEWAPGSDVFNADRLIKTRFLGPEDQFKGKTIAERVALRELKARVNGNVLFSGRTSLNQFRVQVGDYVGLTSPVFLKKNQLGMTAKQFMVVSKDPDWDGGSIDWKLMEVIDANRPPTAKFTASVEAGAPPLTVNFDASTSTDPDGTITLYEWDFDFDGVNFQVDATGVTASFTYGSTATGIKQAALQVTDNNGAKNMAVLVIRVFAAPVAVINFDLSAPDQPLFAVLSSGSYGVTSQIVKAEWDLSYNGTFVSEVRGPTATINLPYQSITVALRVTDGDGQTATATLTLTGKTFAPADVTGFYVEQLGQDLRFKWAVNPDTDIFGYHIRRGSLWNVSTEEAKEILTNSFKTAAPTTPGSYTWLIKAINSTGRESINATAITMTVFDTKDRNVLVTVDRKATGWPGTKTGLVYEVARDRWWIDATGDQVQNATEQVSAATTQVVLRGTRVSGTYEGPAIDLGGIMDGNRLSILISTELTPDPEGVSAKVEYAESDDGTTYSAFTQVSQSDLGFRFMKEKITLSNDDGASNIALQDVDVVIDVPDVFDSGEDVVIPVGGKTIVFNRTFNAIPAITAITIQNMTVALYAKVMAKTKTGFTVQIFRASDNVDVGATIDWAAKGY